MDKKWPKMFQLEIQDGCHSGHLENLFFTSSPEPKGLLYPRHMKYVGVYSFRFSVCSFVHTYVHWYFCLFVRSFVHLSFTGSKFLR